MFCKKCGSSLPRAVHYCRVCGAEVERAVPAETPAAEPLPAYAAEPVKTGPGDFPGILIFLPLLVLFLWMGTASAGLHAEANTKNIFISFSIFGTSILGMALTGRARGIDLSIPYQSILASAIIAAVYAATESYASGMLLSLVVIVCVGFLNGVLIQYFRIPPVIMTAFSGISCYTAVQILTKGDNILLVNFQTMDYSSYILIFILATAAAFAMIFFTRLGVPFAKRSPDDETGNRVYRLTYSASSVFAFLGGVMLLNRLHGSIPVGVSGLENAFVFAFFLAGSRWFDNRVAPVLIVLFGCFFMVVTQNFTKSTGMPVCLAVILQLTYTAAAVLLDRMHRKNLFSFINMPIRAK